MADSWAKTTWATIETGDFVKVKDVIYRVDRAETGQDPQYVGLTLFNPNLNAYNGFLLNSKPVLVRIAKNGALTPAGKRDDGLTDEAERLLQAKLGAELIATQTEGRPWILAERYSAPGLASHLHLFHGLYTGDVKAADGAELRATHKAFHAADAEKQPETARRLPHVHDAEPIRRSQ